MLYFYVHAYFRDCMFGKTDKRLHPSDTEMFNVKKDRLLVIDREGRRKKREEKKERN